MRNKHIKVFMSVIVVLFALLSFENSFAQEENKQTQPTAKDTDLVMLNALVLDKKDQSVKNLGKNDFRVFFENEKQEIHRFTSEPQPLFMGVAIDGSASLRTQLNAIANSYNLILDTLSEQDEAYLMKFVSKEKIYELQDFTSNKRLLASGFDDYYAEGGLTALMDAIYQSSEKLANYKTDESQFRHRVLILITDGEDRLSSRTEEEVFKLLRETNIQIFVLGLVHILDNSSGFLKKSNREKAIMFLDKLAKETGGRAFYPTKLVDVVATMQELIKNLRSQYFIGFVPSEQKKNKNYKVRVELTETQGKMKVISRSGYNVR